MRIFGILPISCQQPFEIALYEPPHVARCNVVFEQLKAFPVSIPSTLDEQHEIVAILDAIDRKINLHKRKRAVLDDLFKALLHKLMTGEIRVADLDLSALERAPELAEA